MAKSHIFSGKMPEYSRLWNRLEWLNIQLRWRGLQTVQPFSRRKEDLQAAIEEAEELLAQPIEPLEPDSWDEPEEYEPEEPEEPEPPPQPEPGAEDDELQRKKDAVLEAIGTDGSTKDIITAIMECLDPDEQNILRVYPSEDILAIAGIFASTPDISIEDAARQFEAQRAQAFDDMANGDYDVDWDIPIF